jgi:hypothetical protein
MQPRTLARFADSLCRYLATQSTNNFATGQWLKSLSDDELHRLNSLVALALEHNNEGAWDDLALTCMNAYGAERNLRGAILNGDQLIDCVTTLRVITAIESMRREGKVRLKYELTIQPNDVVHIEPPYRPSRRDFHFAH